MNYSNCKWCGSRLPENAKNCENCGHVVERASGPQTRGPEPPTKTAPQIRRQDARPITQKLARLFVLMLVIGGVGYYQYTHDRQYSPAPQPSQPAAAEPAQIPTESLKSQDPQVRIAACEQLSKMKPATREMANAMLETLRDSDTNVRGMCGHYIGELGAAAADAIPILIENLQDDALHVRITSADALGAIASEMPEETRVMEPLMTAMADREELVRRSACWSLKLLGLRAEAALPAFKKGASDSSIDVRKCSMDAIADIPQTNIDLSPMVKALQHPQAEVRRTAAEALAKAGPVARGVIPALAPLLKDSDEYVREAAVDALGKCCIETGETVHLLIKALEDPSHSVRKYAVLHLGAMGPKAKAAVPGLIRILSGKEIYLRVWAAEALGEIGPDAAVALTRLREMQTEKIVSNEIEAAQLPGTVKTAIRKIEAQ